MKSLRRNFAWTFVGNMVYAASSWGMLVLLAKLGSPVVVGEFALGLALTAPVILLASLQLRSIQATDAGYEYLFRDYLGLRLLMLAGALLVILGIVLISGYSRSLALTIVVIGVGKAIDGISDVIYGLLQQQEHMDRISISFILKGILSLILLGLGQYLTDKVLWAAIGWTTASLLVLVFYDVPSGWGRIAPERQDSLLPRFQRATLTKLLWLALPLGITLMMISLNSSIPRYVIERYVGAEELGFFSAIAYVTVIGTTVTNSLGQAATPRLAKHYAAQDERAFLGLLLRLVGIGLAMCAAGVVVVLLAGKTILTLLYQPEYAEYNDIFLWLVLATGIGFVGSFLGYGITATRQFNHFTIPYVMVTVVAAVSSILLIPPYGMEGAALSAVLVNIANCITPFVIWWLIRRKQT